MKEETERWLKQSKRDLISAKNSLNSKDYYVSVFMSQQSVEKALKAFLIEKHKQLIKIHDVIILGRKANLPEILQKKCKLFSGTYIESRYGDISEELPYEKFTLQISQELITIANEVLLWVEKNI